MPSIIIILYSAYFLKTLCIFNRRYNTIEGQFLTVLRFRSIPREILTMTGSGRTRNAPVVNAQCTVRMKQFQEKLFLWQQQWLRKSKEFSNGKCLMHSPSEAVKGERSNSNFRVKSEVLSDAQVRNLKCMMAGFWLLSAIFFSEQLGRSKSDML